MTILRCSNRIWYRLWIDMMRIEPLLEGGLDDYIFFYEIRNGRRVLGKDRYPFIG